MQKTKIFKCCSRFALLTASKLGEGGSRRNLMAIFASRGDRAPWLQLEVVAARSVGAPPSA